jgi:hypothetical protein
VKAFTSRNKAETIVGQLKKEAWWKTGSNDGYEEILYHP